MALVDTIHSDLKDALKAKDSLKLSTLRMILSALKYKAIDSGGELTKDEEIQVLSSEAKKRKEAIVAYEQGGRADMAEQEQAELAVIEAYLPESASDEQIITLITGVLADLDEVPDQPGRIVGMVIQRAKQQGLLIEGARVKTLVEEALANGR